LADWIECIDSIDGKSFFDWNDEEIAKSALTRDGQIVHEPTSKLV